MTDAYAATLNPTAPGADAMGSRPPSSDPLDADYRQTINDIRGSMRDQAATLAEKQKAVAPIRQQQIDMLRQPLPEAPQTKGPPQPPKQRGPGDDETWLAAVGVLGAIAGGLTRNHATNALAAMTGAMEGYNEGSKTKFDQQMKQWEVENKAILETNKQANDRYLAILNSRKLALEQKSQELQLTAAQYDDRAAMQLAQTKNFETLGRLIEQRMTHQQKVEDTHARLAQQRQEFDERLAAQKENMMIRMGFGQQGSKSEEVARAISEYRQAPPQSRSPQALALMERVYEIAAENGREYNAAKYPGVSRTYTNFDTGQEGRSVRSLNVSILHLDTLQQLANALKGGDVTALNAAKNAFQQMFGAEAPTDFNAAKQIVGQEVIKGVVASGGGVTERQEAGANIAAARSPQQLAGIIRTYKQLLSGQLVGLRKQYESGTEGAKDFERYLLPGTKLELEEANAPRPAAPVRAPAAAPAAPAAPSSGLPSGWTIEPVVGAGP